VISRVAEHCFWFGRYLERTESSARLLQATRSLAFDADIPVTHCWQPLVIVAGEEVPFVERFGRDALGNGEVVQEYMTWNRDNMVSLHSSAYAARNCARAIREQISLDAWEEVNELYHYLSREATQKLYADNREDFYKSVRRSTQLILGTVRSTMLHEEAMRFLWLGAMLERVGQTARILDMHHHTMEQEAEHEIIGVAVWMSLLRACSANEAFMKKNQGRVTATAMVEFILFETGFPRSLLYSLRAASDNLRRIWEEPEPATRASLKRLETLIAWMQAQIDAFDLGRIHQLLTHVVDETAAVSMQIAEEIQGPKLEASDAGRESHVAPAASTQAQA
jgi:uncharacterized alpha-E superfamily protein